MIRRRDGDWLPFWRLHDYSTGHPTDLGWVVSVQYRTSDNRPAIGPTKPSRWRLVALWRGLRGSVR